jgi:hypothetical protein
MRAKHRFKFGYGFFSQGITSFTNFLTSICAINYLGTEEFQKWFVYVVPTLAIQGVLRTTILESDLIEFGQVAGIRRRAIISASLFPIVLMPIVNGYLKSSISSLDFALAIYCALVLLQDATRYNFLGSSPRLALVSDCIWFCVILALFLVGAVVGGNDLNLFLALTTTGPLLGCAVFLIFKGQRVDRNVIDKTIIARKHFQDSKLRYLFSQSLFGTAVTILTLFILARFCTVDELKTIRIIQTISSPFYALAAAYWLTVVVSKSGTRHLIELIPRIIRNVLLFLVLLPTVLICISFFTKSYKGYLHVEIIPIAIVAISVPVINAITYPTSYFLRLTEKYKGTMINSFIGSGFFLTAVKFAGNEITAMSYFTLQLISILIIQFLNIKLCMHVRSGYLHVEVTKEDG